MDKEQDETRDETFSIKNLCPPQTGLSIKVMLRN